jgi:capsular exopolysaccharide synthesis family protein
MAVYTPAVTWNNMDNENSQNITPENALTAYVDILRRRRPIVVQTFVVVLAVGILVTFLTKPLYRTDSRILVETKAMVVNTTDPNNPLSQLYNSDSGHDVDTQLEVLQGAQVLSDTYREANIPANSVTLETKQSGTTDVIDISTYSGVREYAQKFANTLPTIYQHYVTGNRKKEIAAALTFARRQLVANQAALVNAENELETFRHKTRILDLKTDADKRQEETVKKEAEHSAAEADMVGIQARLNAMTSQRNQMQPVIETPNSVTNPAIQTTKDSIAALEVQRTQKLLLYKPNALEVQQIDVEIREMQRRLQALPPMVTTFSKTHNPQLDILDRDIAAAQTALAEAKSRYADSSKQMSSNATMMGGLGTLERQEEGLKRDIARYQDSIAVFTKNVDDLSLRAQTLHDPVIVITPAPPAYQVAPRRFNNLLVATIAGVILALVFALLQEFLDDGINSPDDSRRILGVPALGFVPMIDEAKHVLLGSTPGGSLLETYRVLRTNVRFSAVDAPIRSLLVTSTLSGEGKSVTVHNLAVAMALDGRRVIIVDTDLRRPTQHKHAGVERSPGLTNVLVGRMGIEEALQDTDVENLRVMTTGPLPPNPTELLSSQAMAKFHEDIKEHCDLVIFDSPPCLVAADAQLLAAAVDGVLYVAQFSTTKKALMRRSGELLQQAQARMLGVVFNKLDLRGRRNDYYYGYYRYYKYYRDDAASLGVESSQRRSGSYREFEALVQGKTPTATASTAGLPAASDRPEADSDATTTEKKA